MIALKSWLIVTFGTVGSLVFMLLGAAIMILPIVVLNWPWYFMAAAVVAISSNSIGNIALIALYGWAMIATSGRPIDLLMTVFYVIYAVFALLSLITALRRNAQDRWLNVFFSLVLVGCAAYVFLL